MRARHRLQLLLHLPEQLPALAPRQQAALVFGHGDRRKAEPGPLVVADRLVQVAQLVVHQGDALEAEHGAARLRLQVFLVDRQGLLEEGQRELKLTGLELLQPVREEGRRHAQGILRAHALSQLRVERSHSRPRVHKPAPRARRVPTQLLANRVDT